jgi:hypothetical protein
MESSSSGAQTERRGDAGPVRDLLAVRPHRPTLFLKVVGRETALLRE